MSILFNRSAALIIGVPGGEAKKFTDLRITFKVNKSSESTPNTAQVEIYNLNEHSRSLCEKRGSIVSILAGYETPEVLFTGDIKKVLHSKNGPTWQTSIESGDGEVAIQTSKSNQTFGPGVSIKDVIIKMGQDLGTSIGSVSGLGSGVFQNGFTASGQTSKILDDLTKKENLSWSIQNGALQIVPKGSSTNHDAVLLTPDTGLIGSPKKKGNMGGIEFETLIQPKIFPGRQIKLVSKGIDGVYTAFKVSHHGDTHGNDWFTTVETSK